MFVAQCKTRTAVAHTAVGNIPQSDRLDSTHLWSAEVSVMAVIIDTAIAEFSAALVTEPCGRRSDAGAPNRALVQQILQSGSLQRQYISKTDMNASRNSQGVPERPSV